MDPFNTETVFSKKKLFFNIRDSFMSRVVDWKKKNCVHINTDRDELRAQQGGVSATVQ